MGRECLEPVILPEGNILPENKQSLKQPPVKADFDSLYKELSRRPLADKVYGEWEL